MRFSLEDLGPIAWGDRCMNVRHGVDPQTGEEVALVSLSRGGFLVINPRRQSARQIKAPKPFTEWWAIAQGPDRAVWQLEYNGGTGQTVLVRWNWQGPAEIAAAVPGKTYFTTDVDGQGRVYLPEYSENLLYRYDPALGETETLGDFEPFGRHIREVVCGDDGLVYVTCTDYVATRVVVLDPAGGTTRLLAEGEAAGLPVQWGGLSKDSHGRAVVPVTRWGRELWYHASGGELRAIDQRQVARAAGGLAFRDGGYIEKLEEQPHLAPSSPADQVAVSYVDPQGKRSRFTIEREGVPLRIFSIAGELGKIWAGTFIPLTLASYDPADGSRFHYGNPTETDGEIYSITSAQGQLFLGSYYGAVFTRFDPARPWRRHKTAADNPGHLGRLREERMLMRPYGVAQDGRGQVYFAAKGGYGVEDSGICRIDPATGAMTNWIYPDTTFTVMCYLPAQNQLLVAERRKDEDDLRFTFVNPENGEAVRSEAIIRDIGEITALLHDGQDTVYGLHPSRATLFAYSLQRRKIVNRVEELPFGHHCYRSLMFGPDGRIWGLTNRAVYALERDLTRPQAVVQYEDHADGNFYRFGMCSGPDGHVYFPNGPHLMRVRVEA